MLAPWIDCVTNLLSQPSNDNSKATSAALKALPKKRPSVGFSCIAGTIAR